MQLNPYLTFDGQCEAAFKFYENVLGGKIEAMMTYGSSPMAEQTPADWRNKIMHARLTVGDKMLMASDAPPDRREAMKGFSVTISLDDPGQAERIFHALSERERSKCRYSRHSGLPALACSSINSARPG